MDDYTFDTDIFSEINDAPGEIFDIPEMQDQKFNVEEYINGDTDYWEKCYSGQPPDHLLDWHKQP